MPCRPGGQRTQCPPQAGAVAVSTTQLGRLGPEFRGPWPRQDTNSHLRTPLPPTRQPTAWGKHDVVKPGLL